MVLVDETSVPWVDVQASRAAPSLRRGQFTPLVSYSLSGCRYLSPAMRHPAAWRDPHGVVHLTEVMIHHTWVDRITVCLTFCLNEYSHLPTNAYRLDLTPCEDSVNCLGCVGALLND